MLKKMSKLTIIFFVLVLGAACGEEEISYDPGPGITTNDGTTDDGTTDDGTTNDGTTDDGTTDDGTTNDGTTDDGTADDGTAEEPETDPYNTEDLPTSSSVGTGEAPRSAVIADSNSYTTMEEYLWLVLEDVDKFWSTLFVNGGLQEPFVYASFPGPGEAVPVKCGKNFSDDQSALYCPEDDQIVISQVWAATVWEGTMRANNNPQWEFPTGDFSVAFFVAHEYAHSLQTELGIEYIPPVKNEELHADCFAGVWASSVNYRQLLEPGDLEEVLRSTYAAGDYQVADDNIHHGTPEERYVAFRTGYDTGEPASCNNYLTD